MGSQYLDGNMYYLKKVGFLSAFAPFLNAQGTQSDSITSITNVANQCNVDGSVVTTFTFTGKPNQFLTNVIAGNCETADSNNPLHYNLQVEQVAGTTDSFTYSIQYDSQKCANPNDYVANINGLPANSTVYLFLDDVIGGSPLNGQLDNVDLLYLENHEIISRCQYGTDYRATFEFGTIDQVAIQTDDLIDTGVLSFQLNVYKDVERTQEYLAKMIPRLNLVQWLMPLYLSQTERFLLALTVIIYGLRPNVHSWKLIKATSTFYSPGTILAAVLLQTILILHWREKITEIGNFSTSYFNFEKLKTQNTDWSAKLICVLLANKMNAPNSEMFVCKSFLILLCLDRIKFST